MSYTHQTGWTSIRSTNNPSHTPREKGFYIGYPEYADKIFDLTSKQGKVFKCLVSKRNKKSNILRITFEEVTRSIGATKKTVNDAIKHLREEDLIKTNKSYIMINPKAYFQGKHGYYQQALIKYECFNELDEIELDRLRKLL